MKKKFEDYAQPIDRDRTARAIAIAKRRYPNWAIILISTVNRNGDYPGARVIQNPSNGSHDTTIILEEKDTTSGIDLGETE